MMNATAELKKLLLENCMDGNGDIYINNLDFSDHEGNIIISGLKSKYDVWIEDSMIGGDMQIVRNTAKGEWYEDTNKMGTGYNVIDNVVQGGDMYVTGNEVDGDAFMHSNAITGQFRTHHLAANERYEIKDGCTYIVRPKKMTMAEIEKALGYAVSVVEEDQDQD